MKKIILMLLILITLTSCYNNNKKVEVIVNNMTGTVLDKDLLKGVIFDEKENITETKSSSTFKKKLPIR